MPRLLFISLLVLWGYYSRAATIRGWHLLKPGDINDGWIGYKRVRRWWLQNAVSSTRSLSVLLSVAGMTRTTQTVLVLGWWPSSETIRTHESVLWVLPGIYSRALNCVGTIRGQSLFEGFLLSAGWKLQYVTLTSHCHKWHRASLDFGPGSSVAKRARLRCSSLFKTGRTKRE